ncbi:MAG: CHAP domain-containing protein [Flavobacteriales bacterium]
MKNKNKLIFTILFLLPFALYIALKTKYKTGEIIDQFNDVNVYYNGSMNHVSGRNVLNGYNLGLKWQCVEFVKRYYYKHLKHKMPNSYGHAKSFYNPKVSDGKLNKDRNLLQYSNPSQYKPEANDIIIFGEHSGNSYGHVAIVTKVNTQSIEIIQQNKLPIRQTYKLIYKNNAWFIDNSRVLGRLRVKH